MQRKEVEERLKWKLEDIYGSDEIWEQDYKKLEKLIEETDLREICVQSAQGLAEAHEKMDEISIICEKLFVYARMRRDEDNSNGKYQAMADRAYMINVKASSAFSYLSPAILSVGGEKLSEWISREKRLAPYEFGIKELLRAQEHVLDAAREEILSRTGEFSGGAKDIFTMLNNADLKFGEVDGQPLTHGSYILFLQSRDEAIRKQAYEKMYGAYKSMLNTIAATYSTSVKKDCFYASVRGYGSALEGALFSDNVSKALYTNLIKTTHDYISVMHDYVSLKKKVIGKDELKMYDIFVPLAAETEKTYSFDEACELVFRACEPLGQDYVDLLKKAVRERWIDVVETDNKTSGAYSWGCYGTHPYVLLNHRGDLDSVFTIAHELGHAMHSYFSNEAQPYATCDYKIFVAEVASTVNEVLLTRYLSGHTDGETKKYVLNHYLDEFRTTAVRQTMFAEFEMIVHEMCERGEPLTPESMSAVYADLNSFYHGSDMICDELISYEWARIPHFYNAFYVYKYSTGIACAVAIVRDILESGDASKYRAFLKTGGSMHPLDELRVAGVDLESGRPVEDCMKEFRRALDEFALLCK